MALYHTTWLDYCLPGGEEFAVAVCGFSGKIRHMTIEKDTLRRQLITSTEVTKKTCSAAAHCLALSCPLNCSQLEQLAHILDMWVDEPMDDELTKLWHTSSTVDAMVKFAEKMNEVIPADLRKKQKPIKKPGK